jgi:hypothetical protein
MTSVDTESCDTELHIMDPTPRTTHLLDVLTINMINKMCGSGSCGRKEGIPQIPET